RNGADVVLTYRQKQAEGESVAAEIEALGRKAVALSLDVGETKSFAAFAETLGGVLEQKWGRKDFDFLVNNAGINSPGPIAAMTEENFDLLCNVHFKGVYFLTQRLLPAIADGGRIVNLSSALARF